MPRATNAPASRERRRRVLKKAKGYRGRRSKLFRYAKDATMKGQYWAYRDRKTRKRNFRMLWIDRKSTRLNSSHSQISYAVFCLKKKKYIKKAITRQRKFTLDGYSHNKLN